MLDNAGCFFFIIILFLFYFYFYFFGGSQTDKIYCRGKKQELVLTISFLNIPPHLDLCQRLIAYPKATIPPYPLPKWGGNIMSQMKENQEFVRAEAAR
jgi:hypothetical protein